jgi:hypothetical protein
MTILAAFTLGVLLGAFGWRWLGRYGLSKDEIVVKMVTDLNHDQLVRLRKALEHEWARRDTA